MPISIGLQADKHAHGGSDQFFDEARIISYSTEVDGYPRRAVGARDHDLLPGWRLPNQESRRLGGRIHQQFGYFLHARIFGAFDKHNRVFAALYNIAHGPRRILVGRGDEDTLSR